MIEDFPSNFAALLQLIIQYYLIHFVLVSFFSNFTFNRWLIKENQKKFVDNKNCLSNLKVSNWCQDTSRFQQGKCNDIWTITEQICEIKCVWCKNREM